MIAGWWAPGMIYGSWAATIAIEAMAIEIVDLPVENGDFP